MTVYMGRDSYSANDNMDATHTTVRHLTCRVEGLGHKIFMDFFSSPTYLMNWTDVTNSCRTVRPNRKGMPCDFGTKQMKLKRGPGKV